MHTFAHECTHMYALNNAQYAPPLPPHRALQVEVQDTVGCGDSFAAAVVRGYISGYSIETTLVLANAVGAATAMGKGAGRNVASAETVLLLLDRVSQSAGMPGLAAEARAALKLSTGL